MPGGWANPSSRGVWRRAAASPPALLPASPNPNPNPNPNPAKQDELLSAAAQLVKPGGLLVYSTCSVAAEENEDRIAAFVATHAAFVPEAAPAGLLPLEVISAAGQLQTWPHRHGVDGAFAARLRRRA